MSDALSHDDVAHWVTCLRGDPESIPWTERRTFPRKIAHLLAADSSSADPLAGELLEVLTSDSKWEVRKAVADALQRAPQDILAKTLARLRDDDNAFVRRAAESALDRRRAAPKPTPKRRSMPELSGRLARLEERFGVQAARAARQIGEMYYDELVGATVHDARGILTPLVSSLNRMIAQAEKSAVRQDRLRAALRKMQERVRLLEQLIDDMRKYALIASPLCRPERLADILEEAMRLAREAAHARGYHTAATAVDVDVSKEITVDVARDWVLLAFVNVIQNAFESFPAKDHTGASVIQIGAGILSPEEVEITVQDNGGGMSREDLMQVLEFLPGNTSKKNHGTGFGLPTARRRIDAHGGMLTIDSEEGVGTRVTITLPRLQATQEA